MANITITNHPLIQHKLSILRDKHTASKEFRTLVGEIAMLSAMRLQGTFLSRMLRLRLPFPR